MAICGSDIYVFALYDLGVRGVMVRVSKILLYIELSLNFKGILIRFSMPQLSCKSYTVYLNNLS